MCVLTLWGIHLEYAYGWYICPLCASAHVHACLLDVSGSLVIESVLLFLCEKGGCSVKRVLVVIFGFVRVLCRSASYW